MSAPATANATRARDMLDWAEKHRPRTLDEIVGNKKALNELRDWAEEWRTGVPDKRAVILAGEPGVGKTTAAHALAHDMGWGVIELNASDQRNEEVVRRIAGSGATNRAFGADGSFAQDGGRQVVILDEADNLFGNQDRGGAKAIGQVAREARQPVILIANDLYGLQRKSSVLRSAAKTIKFAKVHSNSIPPAVRRIAEKENIELEPGVDKEIAGRAGGDLRSAVNDLQALALGRDRVTVADVEALGGRDRTGDIWGLLGRVFYGDDIDKARKALWDVDETPEDVALWIDENLPVFYKKRDELVEGYKMLSRADQFLGRVRRRQQYALWGYAGELMTGGVAVAKNQRPRGARYSFPGWLRKMSTSRSVRKVRDETAAKVGAVTHTSNRRAREDMFPMLRQLMKADKAFAVHAAWVFGLNRDELAFLLETKPTTKKVKTILEQVEELGEREAKEHAFSAYAAAPDGGTEGDAGDEDDVPEDPRPEPTLEVATDDAAQAPVTEPAADADDGKPEDGKADGDADAEEEPEAPKNRSLSDFF